MAVPDAEELQRLLDTLVEDSSRPTIISVDCADEESVYFGVSGSAGFVSNTGREPYYATVGDAAASGYTIFDYDGHETEIPNRHLIPLELARRVIRDYVLTGNRSRLVDWQEI